VSTTGMASILSGENQSFSWEGLFDFIQR
jgi:hypothetical protein